MLRELKGMQNSLKMPNDSHSRYPYAVSVLCLGILFYWFFVGYNSGQIYFENQPSQSLLNYGAVNGALLAQGGYWRIIVSQFVHVSYFHMLCNVVFIFIIGAYIERNFGVLILLAVYLLGGTVGTYASVLYYPGLVSSGASQALCSLIGFVLIYMHRVWRTSKITGLAALFILFIQSCLDLQSAGSLKAGHIFGFITGLAIGLCVLWLQIREKKPLNLTEPN